MITLFNADQAQTALGKKMRKETTVEDIEFDILNPNFKAMLMVSNEIKKVIES